ncbi:MAG: 2-dehydropantoate 2-reductase [Betaproteobacteria bacterium]|jgi:2-dehydropantoate 2-reductase
MKVCVVGAGAVGGLVAGWLGHRLGPQDLTLSVLARGETLSALQRTGLRVEQAGGAPVVVQPIRTSDRPEALGVQDLVVLAVKGPALAAVAPAVQALSDAHTTVLVAMNGIPWWYFDHLEGPAQGLRLATVDPGDQIRAHIPTERVLGCVVHLSAGTSAPGVVNHAFGNRLILGEPAGGDSPRLQQVGDLLTRGGFQVETSQRIQREIWFKLWGNMTMNPISALTGATGDRILDDSLVRAYLNAMMLEAREIGTRFGIPIEQHPEQRHELTRKLGAFRTSMLQDTEAGRPLEIDALLSAACEVGRRLSVPTPHLDSLLGLTRLMARTRGLHSEVGPEGETVS